MRENLTSKDKTGRILVEGEFKICNKPSHCLGSSCPNDCIINRMIARLYELEHKKDTVKKKVKQKGKQS